MAINFRSNTIIKNLRVGPLSGGGNGGGGGSSEPSYLAVGAYGANSTTGAAYVFDATDYSIAPTKLTPSELVGGDAFGFSIAATSNHIVVGAQWDDDIDTNAGAAYVYDATNLSATPTILAPSDLGSSDYFGVAVAAYSNQIAVGTKNSNAVYVYDANNLSATPTKLQPSGVVAGDYFGISITITSNHIVIGAESDSTQEQDAGAVYVYDANNLSATPTKLVPSVGYQFGSFGESVAATSNHIVVGAKKDDSQGDNAGAVYVYDATNLSATPTQIIPSAVDAGDYFGSSVAATSNHIVVGATRDAVQGPSTGATYVYDANNLSATPTKLQPSGLQDYDNFGFAVAAYGNQIIVTEAFDNDQGSSAGAVYVYDATNLSATPTKLTATDGGSNHYFGSSVSLG